jgi:hypothetical protein
VICRRAPSTNDVCNRDDRSPPRRRWAREIIEADVRPHPSFGKRKGGEGKVDQRWRQLLDACSTQPGYYIALSERHAHRFITDAKAARTGEGKSPNNEPVK